MLDVMLKLPANGLQTPRRLSAPVRGWLNARALGDFMQHTDNGNRDVTVASHDLAIAIIPDLVTAFAVNPEDLPTADGPHLMIRLLSAEAEAAWLDAVPHLPGNMEVAPNPGTVGWL